MYIDALLDRDQIVLGRAHREMLEAGREELIFLLAGLRTEADEAYAPPLPAFAGAA